MTDSKRNSDRHSSMGRLCDGGVLRYSSTASSSGWLCGALVCRTGERPMLAIYCPWVCLLYATRWAVYKPVCVTRRMLV